MVCLMEKPLKSIKCGTEIMIAGEPFRKENPSEHPLRRNNNGFCLLQDLTTGTFCYMKEDDFVSIRILETMLERSI